MHVDVLADPEQPRGRQRRVRAGGDDGVDDVDGDLVFHPERGGGATVRRGTEEVAHRQAAARRRMVSGVKNGGGAGNTYATWVISHS